MSGTLRGWCYPIASPEGLPGLATVDVAHTNRDQLATKATPQGTLTFTYDSLRMSPACFRPMTAGRFRPTWAGRSVWHWYAKKGSTHEETGELLEKVILEKIDPIRMACARTSGICITATPTCLRQASPVIAHPWLRRLTFRQQESKTNQPASARGFHVLEAHPQPELEAGHIQQPWSKYDLSYDQMLES